MRTVWMSFVDSERPVGLRFLGVAIVDITLGDEEEALALYPEMYDKANGPVVVAAAKKAFRLGINPGGEVSACVMKEAVPEQHKNKLMTKAELIEAGFISDDEKESVH